MQPALPDSPAAELTTASKSNTRRIVAELLGGAVLGFSLACVVGPNVVSWWYEPPSRDAFSCAGSVRQALGEFVKLQLLCAVLGCALLWASSFFIRRAFRRRAEARSP